MTPNLETADGQSSSGSGTGPDSPASTGQSTVPTPNSNIDVSSITADSPIKQFYAGRSIFITGVTGFVGKVLLEKILRSCDDVAHIYLLLRAKKGVSAQDRLAELLNSRPFAFNPSSPSNNNNNNTYLDLIGKKLTAVDGDITKPSLGLSEQDCQKLVENVNVVFHVAASVKFEAPLSENIDQNVYGTINCLEVAKKMHNLVSFVHVSTAYSNCQRMEIEERVYELEHDPEKVLAAQKLLKTKDFDTLKETLMEGRPNTYTYTKALAEHFVSKNQGTMPVAILRPSIVMPSYKEPIPGWVDSINGPAGLSILGGLGILYAYNMDGEKIIDFIPVDIVANATIAVGWYTATHSPDKLKVYNCTSGTLNPVTWRQYFAPGIEVVKKAPSMRTIRPVAPFPTKPTKSAMIFGFKMLIYHVLFAFIMDLIRVLTGQKKMMMKIVNKMHHALHVFRFFYSHEWSFEVKNIERLIESMSPTDSEIFCVDVRRIKWSTYPYITWMGSRRYLLKEDDSTIPQAYKRYRRICHIYLGIRCVLILFALKAIHFAYQQIMVKN